MVISNEEQTRDYMISRAKSCLLSGDTSYAKCWIMTANALFPNSDRIKFEAYQMCKCEANVEEATKYFCEMFTTDYEADHRLMNEMRRIVIACRNEWQTCKHLTEQQLNELWKTNTTCNSNDNNNNNNSAKNWSKFYNQLFVSLSPQYQYQLLKRVANSTDDKLILVDLLLFTLKRFPKSVSENGIKLIEIMEECEHHYSNSNAIDSQTIVNYLRKKLVFDVLPIIFDANNAVILPQEMILKLMQKSLKYFVEQVISTETEVSDRNTSSNSNNINLENCEIEAKVIEIFHLIGTKNDWQLFKSVDYADESVNKMEIVYEKIAQFIEEFRYAELPDDTDLPIDLSSASTAKINSGDEQTNQQILYATLLLFLLCLRQYYKLSADNILIEQTSANYSDSNLKLTISTTKKRKLQCNEPELTTTSVELKQVFIVASKTLKLLKENLTINSEFAKLSEIIGLDRCRSFQSFLIDSYIYRAEYTKVVEILSRKKSLTNANNIQLISISLMLHDYNAMLKYCLDCIETLMASPKDSHSKEKAVQSVSKCASYDSNSLYSRHLIFLPLSLNHILRYVIEVIVLCLKDRVMLSLKPSDIGIGHLIVLSQYDWPNQIHLFFTCISMLRNPSKYSQPPSQPKFSYLCFLNYIFLPDIIEEFMSLSETKDIVLELKPSKATLGTPLKTSSKVITTRGVNKGVKEEIRSALMSQMKISKSQIPNELFIDFINKEIRSYLISLSK